MAKEKKRKISKPVKPSEGNKDEKSQNAQAVSLIQQKTTNSDVDSCEKLHSSVNEPESKATDVEPKILTLKEFLTNLKERLTKGIDDIVKEQDDKSQENQDNKVAINAEKYKQAQGWNDIEREISRMENYLFLNGYIEAQCRMLEDLVNFWDQTYEKIFYTSVGPRGNFLYDNLIDIYISLGLYDKAKAIIKRILMDDEKRDLDDGKGHLNLDIKKLFEQVDPSTSVEIFARIRTLLRALSRVYIYKKEYATAKECLEQAMNEGENTDVGNKLAVVDLGYLCLARNGLGEDINKTEKIMENTFSAVFNWMINDNLENPEHSSCIINPDENNNVTLLFKKISEKRTEFLLVDSVIIPLVDTYNKQKEFIKSRKILEAVLEFFEKCEKVGKEKFNNFLEIAQILKYYALTLRALGGDEGQEVLPKLDKALHIVKNICRSEEVHPLAKEIEDLIKVNTPYSISMCFHGQVGEKLQENTILTQKNIFTSQYGAPVLQEDTLTVHNIALAQDQEKIPASQEITTNFVNKTDQVAAEKNNQDIPHEPSFPVGTWTPEFYKKDQTKNCLQQSPSNENLHSESSTASQSTSMEI